MHACLQTTCVISVRQRMMTPSGGRLTTDLCAAAGAARERPGRCAAPCARGACVRPPARAARPASALPPCPARAPAARARPPPSPRAPAATCAHAQERFRGCNSEGSNSAGDYSASGPCTSACSARSPSSAAPRANSHQQPRAGGLQKCPPQRSAGFCAFLIFHGSHPVRLLCLLSSCWRRRR